MDQFLVYRSIHFLRELEQANKTIRKLLVRYLTRQQMEALAEVAGYIIRGYIRDEARGCDTSPVCFSYVVTIFWDR
jgi:hypothetical protein